MNIYLESFGIFFKIGAFTIGGGYAMVPLIENEIVTKRKWIAQEDFIDLLAISQSAPGILLFLLLPYRTCFLFQPCPPCGACLLFHIGWGLR